MKSKIYSGRFLICSDNTAGILTLKLIHKVEGIVLHEWKEKVKSEREATISLEAYKRCMFEEDGALVFMVKYVASLFDIDYKGKGLIEITELIKQKAKDLEEEEKTICIQ
ncbi:hypothetical protein [Lysinibacillus sphaericus]|uniref:Uncharacterized protein n=1 Tax=Lysinibacillus sphaericus OT4b.31 TaxID=1285586 RepID=R7ZID2_LYSSH|nr:hypothetical protein [Lysinibacillus sphaericus]EON73850.1 hypothetical protein H131_04274 [Lysinibacillus sphaericus OT4b.31]